MTDDLKELARMWLEQRQVEKVAVDARRKIEDRMKSLIGIADNLEGTETAMPDGFIIKAVGRIDRKVNSDMLQDLAAEYGLLDHLSSLFRWKPEINMTAWKAADEAITRPLAAAITAKPGRPSFSISINEE